MQLCLENITLNLPSRKLHTGAASSPCIITDTEQFSQNSDFLEVFDFWLNFVLSLHQMVPLHVAAKEGRIIAVGFLEAADVNVKDNNGVNIAESRLAYCRSRLVYC